MKAAVLSVVNEPLHIEEVELDDVGPHEVRIRTAASGLCHSDLGIMTGEFAYADFPIVLGHEAAGTVVAVGPEVSYVRVGDRVMTHVSGFCGQCNACLTGHSHICHHTPEGKAVLERSPGETPRATYAGAPLRRLAEIGSFAEEMLLHENYLLKLDEDISFDVAAILGCGVTTGLGAAINTAKVMPGSTVAVVGCGGVGLAVIQGCRIAGALQIIAVDITASRLESALALGATHAVNATEVEDPVAAVIELSKGGVEFSFDAAGGANTTAQAFSMTRILGTCTAVGVTFGKTIEINGTLLQMERKLLGCIMGSTSFRVDLPRWFEFYRQGRLRLDEFVSAHIALEEINEGFAAMQRGEGVRNVIMFD